MDVASYEAGKVCRQVLGGDLAEWPAKKSLRSDLSMRVSMSNAVSVSLRRRMAFLDIAFILFLSSAVSRPAYAGRVCEFINYQSIEEEMQRRAL